MRVKWISRSPRLLRTTEHQIPSLDASTTPLSTMRVETPDDSSAAAGFYALKDLESGSDSYVEVRQGDADADHDETDSTNSSDNEESLLRHGRRPRQRSAPRCESSMLQKRRRCNALYGPRTPRQFRIVPVLETLQTAPLRLVDRVLPTRKHRWAALILLHLLWGAIFLTILHRSVVGPEMGEYGTPVRLSCRARLWCVHERSNPMICQKEKKSGC